MIEPDTKLHQVLECTRVSGKIREKIRFPEIRRADGTVEREADRLSVMLEAGRAQSRATGLAVRWQSSAQGFAFVSGETGQAAKTVLWLNPEIRALQTAALVLGPEPIIAAQSVTLSLQDRKLTVATDGLRPFVVSSADAPASSAAPATATTPIQPVTRFTTATLSRRPFPSLL